ncbi:G-protein regulator 2 [Caenorhabditis elegans]|uniref:G-protein regulator 2 n=1 Tax=Caenorhabditis elegans TaxID=6239 RepID=GPR2_CAEEL|nr:G-protein regulator 2 [Caenorhabditis elegans]Q03569.1 RecName: Full=G-protein regulator 2 [Caenorhabditis elegans]CAA79548.1 G-protein regulator 2 [Caenorhabditis elegans]|eukprot:NP_499066.1 G-protein regulator 2 [Caenorhabditis elegans]
MDVSYYDGPKDEVIEAMLKSAVTAMKLGQYEDGKGRLEDTMEFGTSNFQLLGTIYMYYGRVCRHLNHDAKALEFFEHELNMFKLIFNYPEACDSTRRIVQQALKMEKFSKARRFAEDLIDYTSNKKNGEKYIGQARILFASVCLEGCERDVESNQDEKKKLLSICAEQIAAVKLFNENNTEGAVSETKIMLIEAKCLSLDEKYEESRRKYQECIDFAIKTDQFEAVHIAYYDKALYAETYLLFFIIRDLRSALFYATKFGKERDVVKYKSKLSEEMLRNGEFHEAYLYGLEALVSIRKLGLNEHIGDVLLTIAKCLIALGKRRQAAYFIILGSVLTINQSSFKLFYEQIDVAMNQERSETATDQDACLAIDSSPDPTSSNDMINKFVVKLEHATNVETWEMIVNGIIEDQKKPVAIEKKENEEPVDMMDLIFSMSSRMDDQRTELSAARFIPPRPVSSASKKTTKSHRILPGLRANWTKVQSMKFDGHTMNRILKRSKKSKSSLDSTNSIQGDDTRSDDVTMTSK